MQKVEDIGGDLVAGTEPLNKLGRTAAPEPGERELLVTDIRVDAAHRKRRGMGDIGRPAVARCV
ncbi:hypothetical protein [Methylobacterium sp. E-045]|uniref:hypothetical protein n=1 Tax=Methylobacterium sp. E-045 TaxID=2836575 RepID=UPI001FBBCCB0|nr:hypothetical protein [Methylobacterium sp. E-045]MCJ2127523.1 hypothetical protein [Methylobacterium sp. E-045]